jgi:hypothetical protein
VPKAKLALAAKHRRGQKSLGGHSRVPNHF